jgi:hypothetical protein
MDMSDVNSWSVEGDWIDDCPHIPLPQGSGWNGNWTWDLEDKTNHLTLWHEYSPMVDGYYTDTVSVRVVVNLSLLEDWLKERKGINDKEPEHPIVKVDVIYPFDYDEYATYDDDYYIDTIYESFDEARTLAHDLARKDLIECQICEDCLMYLESEGDEPEQCDPVFNHYLGTASGEDDFHDEFSWQSCECCGSNLGGSRYKVYCLDENHPLRKGVT